jgi:hypothetical protein
MLGHIMVRRRKSGKDVKESIHLLGDIIPAYGTIWNSLSLFSYFNRLLKILAVVISTQPQSLIYDA